MIKSAENKFNRVLGALVSSIAKEHRLDAVVIPKQVLRSFFGMKCLRSKRAKMFSEDVKDLFPVREVFDAFGLRADPVVHSVWIGYKKWSFSHPDPFGLTAEECADALLNKSGFRLGILRSTLDYDSVVKRQLENSLGIKTAKPLDVYLPVKFRTADELASSEMDVISLSLSAAGPHAVISDLAQQVDKEFKLKPGNGLTAICNVIAAALGRRAIRGSP